MRPDEFKVIVLTLKTLYAKEKLFPTDQTMDLWYDLVKDLPYDLTSQVVKEWAQDHEWSPTVADITKGVKGKLREMFPAESSDDWGAAYDQFLKSVSMYGAYREAEGMAMLDELTQSVVNGIGGYRYLCMSETPESDRANFRMLYEARKKREDERKKAEELPRLLQRYKERLEDKSL